MSDTQRQTLPPTLEPGVLTVGVFASIPPSSYHEQGSRLLGFDVDIASGIAEELGLRAKFRELPPKGLLRDLESGSLDIVAANISRTPKRELQYRFADPYMTTYGFFYSAPGSRIRASNLRRARIGVLPGTTWLTYAKEHFPEAEVVVLTQGGEVVGGHLISGAIDVALFDHFFSPVPLKLGFQLVAAVEGPPAGCILRRDADTLTAAVNAAQQRIRSRGEILALLDRYGLLLEA